MMLSVCHSIFTDVYMSSFMFMHLFLCVFIRTWLYMGIFCGVQQETSHQRHQLCFDQGKCSKNITLSNEGKRATHSTGGPYANVTTTDGYTTGIHQWSMKIRKLASTRYVGAGGGWFAGTEVGAGVSVLPRNGNYSITSTFFDKHRAYCWWDYGVSYHHYYGRGELGENCSRWKVGDVITFTLDCEQRTLQILVSRTGKSATLNDLVVASPLYPTVCMQLDNEVELC